MKITTLRTLLLATAPGIIAPVPETAAQCNTSNATSCICPDGSGACDLLPDLTISWFGIENYLSGPNEQPGRVYVTGSTPNIGHGPFVARGVDLFGYRWFLCGDDTVSIYDPTASQQFTCANGASAQQLIFQRIYHKNGSTMTSYQRMMPQVMTYHPSHGHTHFDQWGIFSLRIQDPLFTDPREWPVVGSGYKLGFCLMDYNSCSDAAVNHHCKDDNTVYGQGTTLYGADFPNYGLGGGNYGCSMVEQGISSGYTDIYSEYLDGMWIDIPEGTCDGDYWIVYEVDPHDAVLEEDEENNFTAVPVTLTQQGTSAPEATIHAQNSAFVCSGDSTTLYANAGTAYSWSNGATTNSIMAAAGTYTVTVTNYCGTATSAPFTVTALTQPAPPTATPAIVCDGEAAVLTATGTNIEWYDLAGELVGTGNSFTTPPLAVTTSYNAIAVNSAPGSLFYGGLTDNTGGGGYHGGGQSMVFSALEAFDLKSVKVYAGSAGNRTMELYSAVGSLLDSRVVFVPAGESRIDLDFHIQPGNDQKITTLGFTDLFRNNAGVAYPYAIADLLSITGSTGGASYYYYFYDWEVEVGSGACASDPMLVTAEVVPCSGVPEAERIQGLTFYPNPGDGAFQMEFFLSGATSAELTISDALGRMVHFRDLGRVRGEMRYRIDLHALMPGIYHATVRTPGRSYHRQLVVR